MSLVVIGDSHTAGVGAPRRRGYVETLRAQLGVPVRKVGASGAGLIHPAPWPVASRRRPRLRMITYADRARRVHGPETLLVQLSAHDRFYPAQDVVRALERLLADVGARRVALFGPFWSADGEAPLGTLRAAYADFAAGRGIAYDPAVGWVTPDMPGPDGVHLTGPSHHALGERVAGFVRPILTG